MNTLVLTSESRIKIDALSSLFPYAHISYYSTSDAEIPEQPINSAGKCAGMRIDYVKENNELPKYDAIVSIENGVVLDKDKFCDVCFVVFETCDGMRFVGNSKGIDIPPEYQDKLMDATPNTYKLNNLGAPVTVGSLINQEHPDIPDNNWMAHPKFGGFDRRLQIRDALCNCFNNYYNTLLGQNILSFQDFPKPGVEFKDLSKIISNPKYFQMLVDFMYFKILESGLKFDKVVGLDARGFIYGPLLAYKCNAGFVMARKKGKLPGKSKSVDYGTEYSFDSIEIMEGIIKHNDRILIVDDLVATGGSLQAAKRLVEQFEGETVGCFCVLRVPDLAEMARDKLKDTPLVVAFD